MIKELITLENKNIPIISISINCIPMIWALILSGMDILAIIQELYKKNLLLLLPAFVLLCYLELNIGATKLLLFLGIVYIIRLLCFLLQYNFKICNNKNSVCNPILDRDTKYTINIDGKDEIDYNTVGNLFEDGLLIPTIAFLLVLIFMNNKNMIIKTLCIIFMISLYILIFYGNKNISFKNINCNEKEKICYTFFSESLIYALSLVSAFIIMKLSF